MHAIGCFALLSLFVLSSSLLSPFLPPPYPILSAGTGMLCVISSGDSTACCCRCCCCCCCTIPAAFAAASFVAATGPPLADFFLLPVVVGVVVQREGWVSAKETRGQETREPYKAQHVHGQGQDKHGKRLATGLRVDTAPNSGTAKLPVRWLLRAWS